MIGRPWALAPMIVAACGGTARGIDASAQDVASAAVDATAAEGPALPRDDRDATTDAGRTDGPTPDAPRATAPDYGACAAAPCGAGVLCWDLGRAEMPSCHPRCPGGVPECPGSTYGTGIAHCVPGAGDYLCALACDPDGGTPCPPGTHCEGLGPELPGRGYCR